MQPISFEIREEDKKDIVKRTYRFALRIIYIANQLPKNPVYYPIRDQLIRAGTSIGSNAEEASAGFSKSDFTFKMSIASKEARECNYWLRLIRDSGIINDEKLEKEIKEAIDESNELKKILTSIVKTSQQKSSKTK